MGLNQVACTVKDIIRGAEKVFGVFSGLMLLGIMVLGACDVIGRYVFNKPITGATEINQLLMGGMVFLGWAYVLYKKAHVTVDIILLLYPPRVQTILAFAMTFITLVIFSFILWKSASIALSDWQSGKLVSIIHIPMAPFKLFVSLGALLLCLECIIQMIRYASDIIRGKRE